MAAGVKPRANEPIAEGPATRSALDGAYPRIDDGPRTVEDIVACCVALGAQKAGGPLSVAERQQIALSEGGARVIRVPNAACRIMSHRAEFPAAESEATGRGIAGRHRQNHEPTSAHYGGATPSRARAGRLASDATGGSASDATAS